MAGVLDSKKRILDVILTELGRQQMNKGEFNVSYVTFSDKNAQYVDDGTGVAVPIGDNLYFEAFSSANDEIIPEISNEGDFLLSQQVTPELEVIDGILYETDGATEQLQEIDGYSNVEAFSKLTYDKWGGLQILKTDSSLDNFNPTPKEFFFYHPYVTSSDGSKVHLPTSNSVDGLKPIRVDSRFSGNVNTLFLPPEDGSGNKLMSYTMYHGDNSLEALKSEIENATPLTPEGNLIKMQVTLANDETYRSYNILGQIFVKSAQSINKLLLVDAGEFLNDDGEVESRIFHAGLIYKDNYGISKFSRMLSLIFHNNEG